ncbi:TasA family protein [Brassicibacter mesophilus]|uniref:TasA family protein n=1 Tax=Brassicibacter mesophilus TaxID=745119 RepID=UPI003D20060C
MNKKILSLTVAIAVVFAFAGAGTMAWFTSQATSTNNTFKTGTLILGGIVDGEDVNEVFEAVAFGNMEPGEPPIKVQTTKLKNVGTLPFYLYRLTASDLVDSNAANEIDDTILDQVIDVVITIDGDEVFNGKLSQLQEDNGGFFDPIYAVQPGETRDMVITASMDTQAGNDYQGLSMNCDLTVYATQSETPVSGEDGDEDLGNTPTFSVNAYNSDNYVNFDWNWNPNDSYYEYYKLEIKHETGDVTTGIEEERVWLIVNFYDETVSSLDGINASDVDVDWSGDIVRIKKSAFPSEWEGFEVKISGMQNNRPIKSLPWKYWSLDR